MLDLNPHRQELKERGLTKIEGLVSKAAALEARALIQEVASSQQVYTSKGWQRSSVRFECPKPLRAALNALNRSSAFPRLIGDRLCQIVESLAEEPVTLLPPGQQILFSLPGKEPWSVPGDLWHVDLPRLGESGLPGLQIFTFLDEVESKGGGTLVLAGSHRLMNESGLLRSKELKQALAKEPYFQVLFDTKQKPMTGLEETVGSALGVDLEVMELTGRVGDVYLMDLRALHTMAPNAHETARLMLTGRFQKTRTLSKV